MLITSMKNKDSDHASKHTIYKPPLVVIQEVSSVFVCNYIQACLQLYTIRASLIHQTQLLYNFGVPSGGSRNFRRRSQFIKSFAIFNVETKKKVSAISKLLLLLF